MKPEIKERIEKIQKGEVPEGYKKTKVGIIPEEWDIKELSFLAKITMGQSPDSSFYNNQEIGIPLIQGNADIKNRITSPKMFTSQITKTCDVGDIIMSVRAPVGDISKSIHKACMGRGVCSIKSLSDDDYLYHYLLFVEKKWIKLAQGSTFEAVNSDDIKRYNICFPLKSEEQEKIAKILSTWDKAIELKEKLIEENMDFKRGLMQRLLVGKLRFKEHVKNPNLQEVKRYSILPEEWGIKKASSIFSNISKKNNGNEQLLSATQNNGVIPRDMLDGDVMSPSGDTNSYKLVEEGDFVISLRSFQGGLEYSCYQGIVSPAYTVLKNQIPICKDFYRHLFKSKLFIDRLASSVIGIRDGKQISYGDFSFMLLPYPELKEQEKIASVLNNIDNEIDLLNKELNQLKEQKRGLMQLLLTGIVRVEVD